MDYCSESGAVCLCPVCSSNRAHINHTLPQFELCRTSANNLHTLYLLLSPGSVCAGAASCSTSLCNKWTLWWVAENLQFVSFASHLSGDMPGTGIEIISDLAPDDRVHTGYWWWMPGWWCLPSPTETLTEPPVPSPASDRPYPGPGQHHQSGHTGLDTAWPQASPSLTCYLQTFSRPSMHFEGARFWLNSKVDSLYVLLSDSDKLQRTNEETTRTEGSLN